MNQDIRNIIFDLGGVLVGLDMQACQDAFVRLGAADVYRQAQSQFAGSLFHDVEIGRYGTAEFCRRLRAAAGIQASDAEIVTAWNKMLTTVPDEKKRRLLDLRRHYRVFLLSNTNDAHWQWCARHLFPLGSWGVNDYFDRIYLSYEMHLSKPSPAIFRQALADADMVPEKTLFIDDAAENCAAARALGIHTYQNVGLNDWMHEDNLFRY